jgi:hypothetical protein
MRSSFLGCLCAAILSLSFSGAASAQDKPVIVASVHARNLGTTLGVLKDYVPVPWKPESLLKEVFGEFAEQVALSAPVDVLVALDLPSGSRTSDTPAAPLWGFAASVRSLDEAQRFAQSHNYVVDTRPGFARLRIPNGSHALFCLLSASAGPSKGRLSCALSERERDVVGPALSQLPPTNPGSDLHAELLLDALVGAYGEPWQRLLQLAALALPQKLRLGQDAFDRALTDLTQALVEQLRGVSQDLQSIAIDLSVGQTGIDARLAYRLVGTHSFLGQAAAEDASAAPYGTAPAAFFQLPADSPSASFSIGDAKYQKKFAELFVPLFDGYLAYSGMAPADRQAVIDVVKTLLDSARSAPSKTVVATLRGEQAPAASSFAWDPLAWIGGSSYLGATEGSVDWVIPWVKSLVAAYNRPGVQVFLRTLWKKLDPTEPLPTLKSEAPPKGLGAGAYAVVLSGNLAALVHNAGKLLPQGAGQGSAKARPLLVHFVCVPAAGRLWTAAGTDKAALQSRLATQVNGQVAKTLEQRPGLEALRQPGITAGGFTSLVALSSYLDAALVGLRQRKSDKSAPTSEPALRSAQLFNMVPHHGEVPVTYFSRRQRPSAGVSGSEVIFRVPRLVIEDIVSLVMQLSTEK